MDNPFNKAIESASSIIVLLPQNPDLDSVAAGLSLFLALRDKKDASVSCPTPMRVEFNRLVGVNKISGDLGSKNMVMRFVNHKATDIERVSYDVVNGVLKLTVIPKPQVPAPRKDEIEFSFSGVGADLVIIVSGNSEADFPALSDENLVGVKVAHLGVNSLSGKSESLSFAKPGSSVSEVVAMLIKDMGLKYDSDMATNLIMGIDEGSEHYGSSEVSADTFQIVADLMRAGGRRVSKDQVGAQGYPQGSIPGQIMPKGQVQGGSQSGVQDEQPEEAPNEWKAPKIYKGTSVS